jgi:rhodanese-related sulfurtransferase
MENGVTFQSRIDDYNESLINMLWNHKIKLILFITFTLVAHSQIPYLKETKQKLKDKVTYGNQHLTLDEIDERSDIFDVILDVRTKDEYDKGHVKKSIQIDYKDILANGKDELTNHNIDKTKTLLVYCKSGKRASNAVNHMIEKLNYNPKNIYLTHESYDTLSTIL